MTPDTDQHRRYYDDQLGELKTDLTELKERLEPVIEVWEKLSGLVTVLCWVGKTVKWVGSIVIVVAGAWATITHVK